MKLHLICLNFIKRISAKLHTSRLKIFKYCTLHILKNQKKRKKRQEIPKVQSFYMFFIRRNVKTEKISKLIFYPSLVR